MIRCYCTRDFPLPVDPDQATDWIVIARSNDKSRRYIYKDQTEPGIRNILQQDFSVTHSFGELFISMDQAEFSMIDASVSDMEHEVRDRDRGF